MHNAPSFNPQLIGQTENALRAILNRQLAGTGVSYAQWVALLLTASAAESSDREQLAGRVAHALKIDHSAAESHFQALASSGLIETGRESSSPITVTPVGQRLVDHVRAQAGGITERLWADLPSADLAAAGRVLSTVLVRAEAELSPAS